MFLIILFKSLIIGGLVGVGVGAGAARMFHAPTSQGMGAFRTLGELNSCEGDPASHFSFGLGFFFNAWASSVAAGSFTQDVDHRIIPNWGAAALMVKNRNLAETLHDPKKMAIACGIIGMIVVAFLNSTASAVPAALQVTAVKVLVPAANLLVNTVMPVIFWLAAIDAGKKSGFWATIFGGLAQLIMGNAVPGLVLGILIGKGVEESGWNKVTKVMMVAIVLLFVLSGVVSAFAGLFFTLRYGSSRGDNAAGLELQVVAAVLLGGVSIFGGRGALHGVLAGVLLIGVVSSALRLESVTVNVINIIIGALLVLSVISTSVLRWASGLRRRPDTSRPATPRSAEDRVRA